MGDIPVEVTKEYHAIISSVKALTLDTNPYESAVEAPALARFLVFSLPSGVKRYAFSLPMGPIDCFARHAPIHACTAPVPGHLQS